jgi:hypothetical protein
MDTMNRMGRIMEAHDMILDHHDQLNSKTDERSSGPN